MDRSSMYEVEMVIWVRDAVVLIQVAQLKPGKLF
jgi:hypothetical protein